RNRAATESTKQKGRYPVMFTSIVLVGLLAASSDGHADPDVAPKSFVILKATPSYADARAVASAAADELAIRMDLRQLAPDRTMGLTFPEEDCRSEFGEYPCYVPRG